MLFLIFVVNISIHVEIKLNSESNFNPDRRPKIRFFESFWTFEIKFRSKKGLFENAFKRFLILKLRKKSWIRCPKLSMLSKLVLIFF